MAESRSRKRLRSEDAARKRVVRITRKVSATLGNDFFQSLVKHAADALGADCVYVGELAQGTVNRIATLAVYQNGGWVENFEQDLSGSACAHVVDEGSFASSLEVTGLFPLDAVLARLNAQSFVGYRLSDSAGAVLGVLSAVFSQRLSDMELAKSVLEVFSQRAAAELERKRDYEALRTADERHRAFIASSMDGMWRIEFDQPIPVGLDEEEQIERIYHYGYLAECNEALGRLLGRQTAEDLVGARLAAISFANDTHLFEELRSVVRSGYRTEVVETTPVDPQGRRMYRLRSQFGIVENGELLRIWGTTRDITELRRTELALQASERRCREMLEHFPLPAVVVDPAGKLLFANDALLRLGRWSKAELAARNWFDLLADDESRDQWKGALQITRSGPAYAHLEGRIMSADGVPRLVSWETTLLLNMDGQVESIAAIGTDITSQKAIEAQIRQAQKLEGIGRMAAGVAHDFNNLLTVVLGHTANLLEGVVNPRDLHGSLSAINAAATQCAGLTGQLLAVGRQQRLQPVTCSLNGIVSGSERVIRSLLGGDIVLELQLDPCLRPVNVDPAQIERVLANLAANARDAMPNGGKLVVATANAGPNEAADTGTSGPETGAYARLRVTDTGAGMSEEIQARIFDPFFTTKPPGKGTGLGLSTVYGIVAQSGGLISVDSRPGAGASFSIFLPAAEAAEALHASPE